jgi:hypothetical protein
MATHPAAAIAKVEGSGTVTIVSVFPGTKDWPVCVQFHEFDEFCGSPKSA